MAQLVESALLKKEVHPLFVTTEFIASKAKVSGSTT